MVDINPYGTGDASFQAAGGTPGVRQWVEDLVSPELAAQLCADE